jgi:hypothetical protein
LILATDFATMAAWRTDLLSEVCAPLRFQPEYQLLLVE